MLTEVSSVDRGNFGLTSSLYFSVYGIYEMRANGTWMLTRAHVKKKLGLQLYIHWANTIQLNYQQYAPFANYLSPFIGKFGRFKLYQNSWHLDYITVEILYKGWDMICTGGFSCCLLCCYFSSSSRRLDACSHKVFAVLAITWVDRTAYLSTN